MMALLLSAIIAVLLYVSVKDMFDKKVSLTEKYSEAFVVTVVITMAILSIC